MHNLCVFWLSFTKSFLPKIIFWLLRYIWLPGVHCIPVFLLLKRLVMLWDVKFKQTNFRCFQSSEIKKFAYKSRSKSIRCLLTSWSDKAREPSTRILSQTVKVWHGVPLTVLGPRDCYYSRRVNPFVLVNLIDLRTAPQKV